MKRKSGLPLAACVCILGLLILAAVLGYPQYGRELSYFLCLIFPALYLAAGLSSVRTSRWWVILTAVSGGLLAFVYWEEPSMFQGFLPWLAFYLVIGSAGAAAGSVIRRRGKKNES